MGKQFLDRFFARLSTLPQVITAGAVSSLPVEGADTGMGIAAVSANNAGQSGPPPWAGWRIITPNYLRSIGLPLLRGRSFDERDKPVWSEKGEPAPARRVLISQRLAELLFPKEDATGKRVTLWKGQGDREAEVIGVVADSRERGLTSNSDAYGVSSLRQERSRFGVRSTYPWQSACHCADRARHHSQS